MAEKRLNENETRQTRPPGTPSGPVSDSHSVEYEEVQADSTANQGIPYKLESLGDSITGQYVKRRTSEGDEKYRPQTVYEIVAESDGKMYSVFGNSDLNAKMAKVRIGSHVIIELIAEEPIEGRPDYNPRKIHSVKVAKGSATSTTPRGPRKL